MTRSTVASFQPRQSNHGHKRKGKPVETWMLELEKAQDEEIGSQSLDFIAIEQIADGVEQMVFSWGLDKQERGQEYAKLSKSLAKENSHVLLPWNLNKTKEGLDSAPESEVAGRNDTKETVGNEPAPIAAQPQVARARTPVIGIRRASPKLTQTKQTGSRWLDNRSVSPESASENPHLLKAGNGPPQSKCIGEQCHGVLTSTNRMRTCTTQNMGEILHGFESRAREDSTCQKVTAEQESSIAESVELEIGKDNFGSSLNTNISRKGYNLLNPNDAELWPCLGERSPVWAPEAAPPTPEIGQQHTMNQTKNHCPPPILTCESVGNVSPMLNQSPLCAQSPSPILETAQGSEASNEHDGLFTRTDPQMCSAVFENIAPTGLPFLDSNPRCGEDTESVEVGGHTIKMTALRGGIDVLEDKFQTLVNINAGALGVQEEHDLLKPSPTTDVEELQIALLECAMEYEIKTIEAKMKMQELKLKGQQNVAIAKSEQPCPQKSIEPVSICERAVDSQRLQQLKKQMAKLQHEKGTLSNELHALKKKERQFERQKRSLEDALLRVNRLQREVVKKDQEVVEWQLKEKETKAQLQEVDEKLKRERHAQISRPLEPKKLLTLLPALREWLRSLKKVGLAKAAERRQFQDKEDGESNYPHSVDSYPSQPSANFHNKDKGVGPGVPAHLDILGQLTEKLTNQSNRNLSVNQVDVIICCLTKEIHALQKELTKLARS